MAFIHTVVSIVLAVSINLIFSRITNLESEVNHLKSEIKQLKNAKK